MKDCIYEPQAMLVKNFEKACRCIISDIGDEIFISPDGKVGYAIPKFCYLLNEKFPIQEGKRKNYFGEDFDYSPARATGTLFSDDGEELLQLERDKCTVYVNYKLLKKSFPKNVIFSVNTPVSPVRVYEGERLIGIILPVKVKKDTNGE